MGSLVIGAGADLRRDRSIERTNRMKNQMKRMLTVTILAASLFLFSTFGLAGTTSHHSKKSTTDVHVSAHTTKKGKLVKAHERTAPNSTQTDNYSTKGNVNPYTGKKGTKKPKD